ncbi:MAG: hypothetical protein Q9160_004880 [Pyrenula sp. 1 TL-2023]
MWSLLSPAVRSASFLRRMQRRSQQGTRSYKKVEEEQPRAPNSGNSLAKTLLTVTLFSSLVFFCFKMLSFQILFLFSGLSYAAVVDIRQASSSVSQVPDYFETTTERFPGPTQTGSAPFLVETNPAPFGNPTSFVANAPLETALPIANNTDNGSIFQLVGQLSSYFPNPVGFGANEYALPPGANVSQVHVLHRHGSRYPTGDSTVARFGSLIHNITANGTAQFTGSLTFLNSWSYKLGAEILVPRGRQELFDSGVLHYYNYAQLYDPTTKIVARTTTQDRMFKSAINFLNGFFDYTWPQNATLEPIIEQNKFNNSLAGYFQCPNSNNYRSTGGNNASLTWEGIYLADAVQRFNSLVTGSYKFTTADVYNMQTLCPYEEVAFGFSQFCTLFTYPEWRGFEYSIDLQFYGNNMFGSPTGRAVGIGYVEEVYARLQNHLYDLPPGSTNVNTTLDQMNSTFPLNQTLYFDFSHDTNIAAIITAFGLKQFAQYLPPTGPPADQQMVVSHMEPFAARLVIEIIKTPQPVKAVRPTGQPSDSTAYYDAGEPITYVHFLLNQRTIPLHRSYTQCETRDDGWCEAQTVLDVFQGLLAQARYTESCFGNYSATPYGTVVDGVPVG